MTRKKSDESYAPGEAGVSFQITLKMPSSGSESFGPRQLAESEYCMSDSTVSPLPPYLEVSWFRYMPIPRTLENWRVVFVSVYEIGMTASVSGLTVHDASV